MSIYNQLSEKIGWNRNEVLHIPSRDVARALHYEVVEKNNVRAFETVFRFFRYGLSPVTSDEHLAMDTINDAFETGAAYFKNIN